MGKDNSLFNDSLRMRDPSQQKRKKARTQVNLDGQFHLKGQKEKNQVNLTDLGAGGLSFVSRTTLYPGDNLTIQFKLNKEILEVEATVIRTAGKNFGVQFINPSEQLVQKIQEYIHSSFFEKEKK